MKHQVLFSLKNNEEVFMNVVCCSHDWCFKGYVAYDPQSNAAAKGNEVMKVTFQSETLRKFSNELSCILKLNFHHIRLYSRILSPFADICNQRRVIKCILYWYAQNIYLSKMILL